MDEMLRELWASLGWINRSLVYICVILLALIPVAAGIGLYRSHLRYQACVHDGQPEWLCYRLF